MAIEQQSQQPVQSQISAEGEAVNELSIMDLFYSCLSRWWWFLISGVICMSIAVFYLLSTQKTYTREAQIQIKQDKKGASIDGMDEFANLGLFNSKSSVNDELIAIQSPYLLTEVIKRLEIDYNYQKAGTFRNTVLYGVTNPIHAEIMDVSDMFAASFTLDIDTDGNFKMSKFMCSIEDFEADGVVVSGIVGAPVETPVGTIKISKTDYWDDVMTEPAKIYVSHSSILDAVVNVQKAKLVVALQDKNASVIDVTYKDQNIQRAEDFINTLIAVYNEHWVEDKNQLAKSTSNFISERLIVIEQELGKVDNDISSYKSDNLIPDIGAATNMYMTQANQLNIQINEFEVQLYMAKQIKLCVSDTSNKYQLLPSYTTGNNNTAEQQQIAEYNKKVLERNNFLSTTSSKNPMVKDLEYALDEMRKNIIVSMDNQVKYITAQINSLKSTLGQSISHIAKNPDQAKYLLSVERQQKIKEALYLYLLQKREENELSQAFTAYNTRLICPPFGSMRPTSPSSVKVLGIGFLIALIIPLGFIYLIEVNDTKVHGRKDLENMKVPFVGEIPFRKDKNTKKILGLFEVKPKVDDNAIRPILVKPKKRDTINEAFRVLRSNFEFMSNEQDVKVVLITSMLAGSGKSFVSGNLAASFAIKGKKVIVLDLDLRKGSLSAIVGNPESGVSTYLAGYDDDWHSLLRHHNYQYVTKEKERKTTVMENLDILPSGTLPPNPAELFYSERFEKLINELKAEYDLIFFDCPPVEIVADTAIVAKHANCTLFVIRTGNLEREMLPVVDRFYLDSKLPKMGVVLNGGAGSKYGRYSRYGKGYGYGYGYGNSGDGYHVDEDDE